MQTREPALSVLLDRHPSSAARARHAVQQFLGDDTTIAFTRDALLLTSELVANAVAYTTDGCHLSAWFDSDRRQLRVEVSDASAELPGTQVDEAPSGGLGRGLRLVDTIAADWGTISTAHGKTIWFELYD